MAVQVVQSAVGDVAKSKDGKIPGAIVLLSDGAQTRGDLTPLQGADRAKRPASAFSPSRSARTTARSAAARSAAGLFGGSGRFVVPPDPVTLAAIARDTDGETFRAKSADKVEQIYKQLGASIAPPSRAARGDVVVRRRGRAAVPSARSARRGRWAGGCRAADADKRTALREAVALRNALAIDAADFLST